MDFEEFKKNIEFAISAEKYAQYFYRDAANSVSDAYLKEMFHQFAREEEHHEKLLREILEKGKVKTYFHEVEDFKVSELVEKPRVSDDMKPADAFALAMKNEEEAMNLYLSLAECCSDAFQKKVFEDLAAMERQHKNKMEKAFVDIAYPETW